MKTNLHLVFPGTCDEAFTYYEAVFGSERIMTSRFGDAPGGSPVPAESAHLVMHTSMPLGGMLLMGCDAPKGREEAIGGFQVSIDTEDEATVRRVFAALSEGGSVSMPLAPTFWSPLFGMLKDKFGVGWMVSVPGPQM